MVRICFAASILKHVTVPNSIVVDARSVDDALNVVFSDHPQLRGYLLDDQGSVRFHVTVFVNSQTIKDRKSMSDKVAPGDEIYIFQALSGG